MNELQTLFQKAVHAKTDNYWWKLIRELRKDGSRTTFDFLSKKLNSTDLKEREIAAASLSQFGKGLPYSKEVLTLFLERLPLENELTVLQCLLSGIHFNHARIRPDQLQQLISIYGKLPEKAHFDYIFALIDIPHRVAVDELIRMSAHKSSNCRNWATYGLSIQTKFRSKSVIQALWARIHDRHQETRYEAIDGLLKRKALGIEKVIEHELGRKNIGTMLFDCIGEHKLIQFEPKVEALYEEYKADEASDPSWFSHLRNCRDVLKSLKK